MITGQRANLRDRRLILQKRRQLFYHCQRLRLEDILILCSRLDANHEVVDIAIQLQQLLEGNEIRVTLDEITFVGVIEWNVATAVQPQPRCQQR